MSNLKMFDFVAIVIIWGLLLLLSSMITNWRLRRLFRFRNQCSRIRKTLSKGMGWFFPERAWMQDVKLK